MASSHSLVTNIVYPPSSSNVSNHTGLNPEVPSSSSLQRRNSENSHLFSNVVREFQQHVENARIVNPHGINISNLFSDPIDFNYQNVHNRLHDSVVINIDNRPVPPSELNFTATSQDTPGPETNSNSEMNDGNSINTETVHNVMEAQRSLQFLVKYFPFCLILLSKAIYDHCEGIFDLIVLCATFMYANSIVKREAIAQVRRSFCKLLITLLYIFACFAFIAYVFEDEKLYLNLVFIPPYKQPSTIWDLLWATGLTDFILKLVTIIFKVLLTMLPAWIIPFKKRGKIYLFIEAVSQLYRSLATIQPWLFYLLESYQGAEKLVGVFLSASYMVSKGGDLMSRIKLFKTAILKLIRNVALGSQPSKDQIQTAGNYCPICHDAYDSPVLLECHHIFCEGCVSTWFDREQTCPLCRAKIVDDPTWRDGSTTFFMQLF